MKRLVILGGSSPFTAALVDALVASPMAIPAHQLVLQGRSQDRLKRLAAYAARHLSPLGWTVVHFTDQDRALAEAELVVHQNRYGGLSGRGKYENLSLQHGLPPDETLGPGALASALRMRKPIRALCKSLIIHCPDAIVLNLTNPLSVVTQLMFDHGLGQAYGVCELPSQTALDAAKSFGVPMKSVEWTYVGLNHRGFVSRLQWQGRNLIDMISGLPEVCARLGLRPEVLNQLQAIPTKYFDLLTEPWPPAELRSRELMRLQALLDMELQSPKHSPPSLSHRATPWYSLSLVPIISALASASSFRHTLNVGTHDGIAWETHASITAHGIRNEAPATAGASPQVMRWVNNFVDHERTVMAAVTEPSRPKLREALALDPMVARSSANLDAIVDDIWQLQLEE